VNVLLALEEPHLVAGLDRSSDLRCPVEHRVELLRLALDPATLTGHEQLTELLVPLAFSGALLADDLLDQAVLVVDVGVALDLDPVVLDIGSGRGCRLGQQ